MYNIPFYFEYSGEDCSILENLYVLKYRDETMFTIELTDENHPIFKAHFPNNPILPGFVLLDLIAILLNIEIISIKRVKFLSTIRPNSILDFYTQGQDCNIKIIVKNNEQKVADISYEKK